MRGIDLIRCVDNNNDDDDTADNVQVILRKTKVVIVAVDLTMCRNFIRSLAFSIHTHHRRNPQNKTKQNKSEINSRELRSRKIIPRPFVFQTDGKRVWHMYFLLNEIAQHVSCELNFVCA